MSKIKLIAFVILNLLLPFYVCAQIEHVEPPNWWIGMKSYQLQLMIHGKNVGETTPSINYLGVMLEKFTTGDSKNYLFLDVVISTNAKPGSMIISFGKNGKMVYTHSYPLLQRDKDADLLKGFNASDVVCLIVPDRFANGDYTNDVVKGMRENKIDRAFDGGRHGGDIRGIINHLDYISQLGYTAIWSTPLLENDMQKYSYHGYSITNHYKVDPRFGTLDDYKELAVKARQNGLKIIIDDVINHTGSNYWWMNDLPFKNWINYPDSLVITSHRRTVNQDKYASEYDKKIMTEGWFDTHMPDMNGKNNFMANYLIQSSIWWVETLHAQGIRQDTYCYSDKIFSKNWICAIMNEYPEFNIVGEEWSLNPLITSYWQQGKINNDGYKSCLKTVMDFPLQSALISSLLDTSGSEYGRGITKLYEALANDFAYSNPNNILVMGDNHDMDRIYTQLHKDIALTKMAITYLLTVRGIPQLFYGTEILMDNSSHLSNHGIIRSDFPGGWNNDVVDAFTGKGLTSEQLDMQKWFTQILNWRKNNSVFADGELLHFAPFDNVYVYFRYNKEKMVMVVMNKNTKPMNIDLKRFEEIMGAKTSARNIFTKAKLSLQNPIQVEAKSATVFELE